MVVMGIILIPGIKTLAGESSIKSRGSIEGIINFYSDDIRYLEEEIDKLFEECKEELNYE